MYVRIFGGPAAGTVQDQRDRSSQWARSRADVGGLIMTGPDSRRLPLGTLVTGKNQESGRAIDSTKPGRPAPEPTSISRVR